MWVKLRAPNKQTNKQRSRHKRTNKITEQKYKKQVKFFFYKVETVDRVYKSHDEHTHKINHSVNNVLSVLSAYSKNMKKDRVRGTD